MHLEVKRAVEQLYHIQQALAQGGVDRVSSRAQGLRRYSYPEKSHRLSFQPEFIIDQIGNHEVLYLIKELDKINKKQTNKTVSRTFDKQGNKQ